MARSNTTEDRYIAWHPNAKRSIANRVEKADLLTKAQLDQWSGPTNGVGEELYIGIVTDGHADGALTLTRFGLPGIVVVSCDCGARKLISGDTVDDLRAKIETLAHHPRGNFRKNRGSRKLTLKGVR